ncbi:10404_t:CDS:2, partial [Scutellospora calospora]
LENEEQVLEELSEFVEKTSGFSASYLWALMLLSILATSAASKQNWSSFNFLLSIEDLRKKGYLIENNAVSLKLNETKLIEENNVDIFLSDSSSHIDIIDYTDKISDIDIIDNVDYLDDIDDMSIIDNISKINNIDSNEQVEQFNEV